MTQRHGIYSVPLPISGKKVAASVVTLAAIWKGRSKSIFALYGKHCSYHYIVRLKSLNFILILTVSISHQFPDALFLF